VALVVVTILRRARTGASGIVAALGVFATVGASYDTGRLVAWDQFALRPGHCRQGHPVGTATHAILDLFFTEDAERVAEARLHLVPVLLTHLRVIDRSTIHGPTVGTDGDGVEATALKARGFLVARPDVSPT